jgi:hypothetical protein
MRKLRITALILFSFFSINCYLHHATIEYGYLIRPDIRKDGRVQNAIPIRIYFNDVQPKDLIVNKRYKQRSDDRKSHPSGYKEVDRAISNDFISNFYSLEILSQFRGSPFLHIHPDANITIRIQQKVLPVTAPDPDNILSVLTLTIIPAAVLYKGSLEFEVFDSENNRIIKTYKYLINDTVYTGIITSVFGGIFSIFSDSIDHSTNLKTFAIMRVGYKSFERDFIYDYSNDEEFASSFIVHPSPKYHLKILESDSKAFQNLKPSLSNALESEFAKQGLYLLQANVPSSPSKNTRVLTVSNPEITKQKSKTQLSFTLECTDHLTGRLLWSELVTNEKFLNTSLEESLSQSIHQLLFNLRLKGNI